ncbi:PREDICTED: vacuolar sorting-associated protein 8 homolog [Prunus dulcis]|uniref:PREDICTED: vacuolar sorting-associated protein 8 homolog n=2 Tax=Prunus dulcis TaxID=3755 RepID=A0A5E4FBQ4_PRUDU|nr:PREDICTED: vacuolar sorting-associated protein 8 homolog [Prunus dulcis]
MIQLMQIWSCRMGTIQWLKVRIQWFKVDTLIHVIIKGISPIDGSPGNDDTASIVDWPSKKGIGHLFEFSAYYVACGRANVSKRVLSKILVYLTSKNNFPSWDAGDSITSKSREKQVLGLLEICGLIHTSRYQYLAAVDCYMKDIDEPVHAFSFINKILLWLTDNESAAFQSQVIYQIPEFFYLNREGTFVLVFNNFTSETISSLNFVPIQKAYSSVIEVHLSGPRLFKFKKR